MTVKQAVKIRSIFAKKLPHPNMHSEECYKLTALLEEAIEKQIPKKPKNKMESGKLIPSEHGECPSCGKQIDSIFSQKYCTGCGQRILWRDEDDWFMEEEKKILRICDNCKHSELTRCLGYLECNKRLDLGNVVYFTDKACDDWEAKEK